MEAQTVDLPCDIASRREPAVEHYEWGSSAKTHDCLEPDGKKAYNSSPFRTQSR